MLKLMVGLLGGRRVAESQLISAFAACVVGGDEFAQVVLQRAVEVGLLERADGEVWAAEVPDVD